MAGLEFTRSYITRLIDKALFTDEELTDDESETLNAAVVVTILRLEEREKGARRVKKSAKK